MDVEGTLRHALAGSESAWVQLLGGLWEHVEDLVRRSRHMGQLRGSVDHRREVVSRVFARFRRNDFRALRTFDEWQASNIGKTFDDWLAIVTTNVVRDYVSERIGSDGMRRLVDTLADALDAGNEPGLRPSITNKLQAQQLLEVARELLSRDHFTSIELWLGGANFDEIGAHFGIGRPRAERRVRAALQQLRREVRRSEG